MASQLKALFARLHFVGELRAPLLFIFSVGRSGRRPTPMWRRCGPAPSCAPPGRRLLGCGVTAVGGVPADAYEHGPFTSMAMVSVVTASPTALLAR